MTSLLPTLLLLSLFLKESSTAPRHGWEVKYGSQLRPNFLPQSLYSDGHAAPKGVVVMGDMLVPQSVYQEHFNSSSASTRKGVPFNYLWPREGGVPTVPYEFQDTRYSNEIEAGMRHWEEHTCLTFRPRKDNDTNWLRFIYGNGCFAYIGKQSNGGQDVSIGQNCQTLKIVVHEVGHAIGLFHEQMRSDRDDHVVINWENINSSQRSNFVKQEKYEDNRSVPYDYTSIMHYEGVAFSNNGRTTMATKLPEHQGLLGRTQGLTHRDKHIVNLMYGCIDTWRAQCPLAASCEGEGYLGRDCVCVCPPGREGERCEVHKSDYYDDSLPACSMTITTQTTFSSPNYPQQISRGTWCVYKVEAPVDMVPEVIFHSFSLFHVPQNYFCYDVLEVRDSSLYEGGMYCGNDIRSGQSFVGKSRYLYLYMDIFTSYSPGFKAEVLFHNASNPGKSKSEGVKGLASSTVLVLVLLLVVQVCRML